jgi:tRNA modification GTPase
MVPGIATALLGTLPEPRVATFSRWREAGGEIIDSGIALYFPAPHSFTGEHVLELQGHGGVISEALIERIVQLGARRARAGEFSERAFLNDKIDLAQAEAIADLIDAGSQAAARAAMRSLQGEFSQRVRATRDALTQLRVYVEAAIDFPEEEIDFLASAELRERVEFVRKLLDDVLTAARRGALLTRGMTVVIAGRPNAGKSTLLNALAGFDAAIVTPVPGTTRDLLRQKVEIGGVPMEFIDTAGLRESTDDAIEAEGMRRAREVLQQADHVLYVVDAAVDPIARSYEEERTWLPNNVPLTLVMNKSDLAEPAHNSGMVSETVGDSPPRLMISALTEMGLHGLRAHLTAATGHTEGAGGSFTARIRHVEALESAARQLGSACQQLAAKQGELAAFELRGAQVSLVEVIGDISSDELLGRIFGSFCIGK